MLKVSEVVNYIESTRHIKLQDIQKDILKHIINGEVIYTPRCCGRSMLYDGYAEYLKNVVGKSIDYSVDPLDFDAVFTLDDIGRTNPLYGGFVQGNFDKWKNENTKMFNREYMCIY